MRTSQLFTLVLAGAGLAGPAAAAPPLHSDEEETQAQQAPAPPAPPAQAAPPAQGPLYFNGPVYIVPVYPAQPAAPPVYAPPAPPVYAPPVYTSVPARTAPVSRPARAQGPQYRFGIGARPTGMWLSQRLYGSDLLMMGGGLQARLRVASQVALEATFDVIGKDIHEGVFSRTSYPLQLAALFYVMPPHLARHFNVYGALGGGVMASRLSLDDQNYPKAELKATELIGQAGVGCELRLWRLSLNADARAIGTYRTGDDAPFDALVRPTSGPNSLSLTQPAVQDRSYGWLFSVGAMIWL